MKTGVHSLEASMAVRFWIEADESEIYRIFTAAVVHECAKEIAKDFTKKYGKRIVSGIDMASVHKAAKEIASKDVAHFMSKGRWLTGHSDQIS